MPTKMVEGKMWKVAEGYEIVPSRSLKRFVIAAAYLVRVDKEEDADFFITLKEKRQCPYCSRKTCLEEPFTVVNTKPLQRAYGACRCKTSGKQFIIETKIKKSNALETCVFCRSSHISIRDITITGAPELQGFRVICGQCSQDYVIHVPRPFDEKKRVIAKLVERFGRAKRDYVEFSHRQIKAWKIPQHSSLFVYKGMPSKTADETLAFLNSVFSKKKDSAVASIIATQE